MGKRIRICALVTVLLIACTAFSALAEKSPDSVGGIRTLLDLNGKRAAVMAGSVDEIAATEHFPNSPRHYTTSLSLLCMAVDSGKADFCLLADLNLKDLLDAYPSLVAFPEPVESYACSFALKKGAEHIQQALNAFVAELNESGEGQRMKDDWYSGDVSRQVLGEYSLTGENGTLRVAIDPNFYPLGFYRDGELTGFGVALLTRFCQRYGYEYDVDTVDFSAAMTGLATRKYDLYASPLLETPERREAVLFSDPLYSLGMHAVVRREDVVPDVLKQIDAGSGIADQLPKGFRQPSDLNQKGISLGVIAGSTALVLTEQLFPNAELVYANDKVDRVMMLDIGRIDGMIVRDGAIGDILEEYPSLFMFPDPISTSESAFFSSKDEKGEKIVAAFNACYDRLMTNGEYDQMTKNWLSGDDTLMQMPELPLTGENGTLRIAGDAGAYPYSFMKDGQWAGLYAELVERFCAEMGYLPKFNSAPSMARLIGVQNGKYDLFADDVTITQERKEAVLFCRTIAETDQYLLVRRADVSPNLLAQIDARNGVAVSGEPAAESGLAAFWSSLKSSFEKNFLRENRWRMLLDGLLVTMQLAALSAVFGTLLGALICWLRLRKNHFVRAIAATYVKIFQGTPIVVLLLVLYYVIFGSTDITAFAVCVLGFSLDFAAYVSEMMRSSIEAVPVGQKRAALALGYGQSRAFIEIIPPQAVRHILPVYRGQLVAMVKMTSIAGYISVEDLTKVSDIIRSRTYEAFFPLICTALIYFLLANLLTSLLKLIQFRTDPNNRKRLPKGVK